MSNSKAVDFRAWLQELKATDPMTGHDELQALLARCPEPDDPAAIYLDGYATARRHDEDAMEVGWQWPYMPKGL